MDVTFPGESAEYRAARNELLAEEIELRRADGGGRGGAAGAAARRRGPGGLRLPGRGARRQADGRAALGALRAGQGLAGHLQLHVPSRSRGRPPGAGARAGDGEAAARRGPVPVLRRAPRPARRDGRARQPAHELRGGGEGPARSASDLEARARLAPAAAALLGRQHLQPRTTSRRRPRAHSGRC